VTAAVGSLDEVVRPLLAALAQIGRFDVAYLTTIDWEEREQEVRFAHNVGAVTVAEGHRIPCPPSLTERVFLGVTRSTKLPTAQPDSHVARSLGLATYVSVAIVTVSHRLFGTLCAASTGRMEVSDTTVLAMEHFSRLLADHLAREEASANVQRAAAAEQQLEDRALFMAEAEHMLKAPLSIIVGWAATLSAHWDKLTDEERTRGLTSLETHANSLSASVTGLLEEARADVRSRRMESAHLNIAALVRSASPSMAVGVPNHDLHIDSPPSVHAVADPRLLEQVLAHLVDNAAKYSAPGTTIDVVLAGTEHEAVIDVRDEGIGIPPGVDVFAAFTRGEGNEVRSTNGVGLGLHIVRSLVGAMGGTVTASRNQGPGSTFSIRLPNRD
jgi:K+-sensing histidine kinase KdpD